MAKGRIIAKTLSTSKKMIAAVKIKREFEEFIPLLYSWIVTHTDDHGHFDADPLVVKCKVMPLSTRSENEFLEAIKIMESVGLIELYNDGGFLEIVNFEGIQTFRNDRTRQKAYPDKPVSDKTVPDVNHADTSDIPMTYQADTIREEKVREEKVITSLVNEKPLTPDCPHKEIIDLYHIILPELPKISTITKDGKKIFNWQGTRRAHLKARWAGSENRQTIEWWAGFFKHIQESDFLMGRKDPSPGRSHWAASLDWIIKQVNFDKIIEGNFNR